MHSVCLRLRDVAGAEAGIAHGGSGSPAYVGQVWISTDSSAAPGTLRIFLANGSLVMDSCGETYRIAPWRSLDERRLEWTEDTARIEAEIVNVTAAQLHLRLKLVSEMKDVSPGSAGGS